MIYYEGGWQQTFCRIFKCSGSLLPKSLAIAFMPAVSSALLQMAYPNGTLSFFNGDGGILRETQAWSGFSFLVGFLIVFRTSQAYSRFWEGCTASHQMRAEWFDACSSVVSFTKHARASPQTVRRFKELLIRLTSMLHAGALAELEKGDVRDADVLWAHQYDLIDPQSIDSESLEVIKRAEDRVELIFEWIQQLIVENIETGVLSVPAPLLSRAFQELATGMVQFHNAMKIAYIPLPFPYAQTCDCLLVIHTMIVPIITSQWVTNSLWAAVFTLVQVLVLWSLNLVALEIENPFGKDANDMDGHRMQQEMNRHLLLLVSPTTERTPRLSLLFDEKTAPERANTSCFHAVLTAEKRRSSVFSVAMTGDEQPRTVEDAPEVCAEAMSRLPSFSDCPLSSQQPPPSPCARRTPEPQEDYGDGGTGWVMTPTSSAESYEHRGSSPLNNSAPTPLLHISSAGGTIADCNGISFTHV